MEAARHRSTAIGLRISRHAHAVRCIADRPRRQAIHRTAPTSVSANVAGSGTAAACGFNVVGRHRLAGGTAQLLLGRRVG
jgi:hypothetical protein